MKLRNADDLFKAQVVPARLAVRRLKLIYIVFLAAGEVALAVSALIYYHAGDLSALSVFVTFVCFSALLLIFATIAYLYTRRLWLRLGTSESELYSLRSISADAVLFIDGDFVIRSWSLGAEDLLGYSQGEAVGSSVDLIMPDGFLDNDSDVLPGYRGQGMSRGHRTYRKKKNGEVVPVEITTSTVSSPDGEILGHIALVRDISERVRMEEELAESTERLRESRERYRNLFETASDGIVYSNTDGVILQCNEAFASMLEYERDELEGLSLRDVTPPEWLRVDDDIYRNQLLRAGQSDEYYKEYVKKDGTMLPCTVKAWLVYDRGDTPMGAWAVVKDMSERKLYEDFIRDTLVRLEDAYERLQETDQLKTEFVAVVSHELRAPLGALQTSLNSLLAIKSESGPDEERLLGVLKRGVARLSRLIDDLMDIARIESGQLKLEREHVSAGEIASRVVKMYEDSFLEKGISLDLASPDGPCSLMCDSRRVEQVLTNLIDNALKFTGTGGVTVEVDCTPNHVIYAVTDTGPGVPPELHAKIFEKFFSAPGTNDTSPGIGLGLAISKGIVQAHGGSMWVETHGDSGVTFTFDLPRRPPEEEDTA